MANNMRIYLASPFFNELQLTRVHAVENLLDELHIKYYSPRKNGIVLKDLTPAQRLEASDKVFEENVTKIMWATVLVAIMDDRDTGTTWELGLAYGLNQAELGKEKIIIMYSAGHAALNVMLAKCCDAHAVGIVHLKEILQHVKTTGHVLPTRLPDSVT